MNILLLGMPGGWEWVVILAVIILLFGGSKLPQLAKAIGQIKRSFREGIEEGEHTCDAIALEDSSVCVVPYSLFECMCRETDALQKRLHRMMSHAVNREANHVVRLGMLRADERVARLLLDLSSRLSKRGYASSEFTLRMTRDDMGSYLGMTLETVSRTLSRFDKAGLIEAQGKFIRIRDFDALRAV